MSAIRINGIRVGHQMFHLRQYPDLKDSGSASLLYQTLAVKGINSPCLGVEQSQFGHSLSCCLEDDLSLSLAAPHPVCMISVYPHGSKSETLGYLLSLFGQHKIDFFHMVSSNAMISFVIAEEDKTGVLAMLELTFDLPSTHTPYEPRFHEETAAFVKKRYQETRAYFQELKIKTYGFALEQNLDLSAVHCGLDRLEQVGQGIGALDTKFYFTTALGHGKDVCLYWVTQDGGYKRRSDLDGVDFVRERVDLVSFHGPHFGDRFGIFNAAAACLGDAGLEFLLAGCTGASISLVLPAGQGGVTLTALEKGFETP